MQQPTILHEGQYDWHAPVKDKITYDRAPVHHENMSFMDLHLTDPGVMFRILNRDTGQFLFISCFDVFAVP